MAKNRCKRKGGCSNRITFNRQRTGSGFGNETSNCWILENSFWDDLCFWVDLENWND